MNMLTEKYFQKELNNQLKIINLLNKNKIEYVVLKGLSLWYFDRSRKFSDLDILVRAKDKEKIVKLLTEKFHMNEFGSTENSNKKMGHHISVYYGSTVVEIHYSLVHDNLIKLESQKPFLNRVYLKFKQTQIPCLAPELQLLSIITHMIFIHWDTYAWQSKSRYARFSKDINIIINNYPIEWNKFIRILRSLDCLEIVYHTMIFLNSRLEYELYVPNPIFEKMHSLCSKCWLWAIKIWDYNILNKLDTIKNIDEYHNIIDWKKKARGTMTSWKISDNRMTPFFRDLLYSTLKTKYPLKILYSLSLCQHLRRKII